MRLIFLCMLTLAFSQIAAATNAIWLKDSNGVVCTNSLSQNAGQLVGLGDATSGSMTIDNPSGGSTNCAGIPITTSPVAFSGFAKDIVQIWMSKPGTNGNIECLDQGNNTSGVHGSAINGAYTLTLGFSSPPNSGCPQPLPTFNRSVTLNHGTDTFIGTYYVYNTANSVPEPGTIMLLLAGLFGLVVMSWVKRGGNLSSPCRG